VTKCTCDELVGGQAGVSPVCLAHLWLFGDLSEAETAALTAAAWRKPLEKGQYAFIQGQPATLLFVIKAGRVKLVKTDEDGTEILVDIRKAGDFLGETFLSAESDYPLTAECMEDSLLCGFSKERFERLVTENPNIGLQIMRNMSERISWLTSRVGSMRPHTSRSASTRYSRQSRASTAPGPRAGSSSSSR
jgi:CRP-like cAMP-binding protein